MPDADRDGSAILLRLRSAFLFSSSGISPEAMPELELQAENPILVSHTNDRNIFIEGQLELNHLILRGRGVRNVGQGEITRDLLFYRDSRARSKSRLTDVGVDLDAADAEELLDSSRNLA